MSPIWTVKLHGPHPLDYFKDRSVRRFDVMQALRSLAGLTSLPHMRRIKGITFDRTADINVNILVEMDLLRDFRGLEYSSLIKCPGFLIATFCDTALRVLSLSPLYRSVIQS